MPQLTELTTYDDVMRSCSWDRLWALCDGDRERMHLAHEYLDRHRDRGTAISVKFADSHREHYDYATLSEHEYPRQIEFVTELPRTPAGKINRQALRSKSPSPPPSPGGRGSYAPSCLGDFRKK